MSSPQRALLTEISVWGRDEAPLREHLKALALLLWTEGEGMSSKRPFGSGGWESELEDALFETGIFEGEMDADGVIEYADPDFDFDDFIAECIKAL